MAPYRRRVIDTELDELLPVLPAISIEGPKGVGKTATATRRATTVYALDDAGTRELLAADPDRINRRDGTVLIDEWQRQPAVWDLVRRSVDDRATGGRFLLTGSAAPMEVPTHSGAGRIVQVRMRPLSLAERGIATPSVRLADLLTGDRPAVGGDSAVDLRTYVEEIVGSGFPAIRGLPDRARRAQLDGYVARIVERDFVDQGLAVRRPATLRAWLAAYAAATSTSAAYNTILDAATPGDAGKPAKTTTIAYREILRQLWLIEELPGWLPSRSHLTRLGQAPKHHLADPALATRLLGVGSDALLSNVAIGPPVPRDGTLLGALFESLVTLSVRVYAQACEATVHHLRTHSGEHEVDLIVARTDGKVVAFEVKLAPQPDAKTVEHLRWLKEALGDDLLDAAVITTGREAYRRADGIAVIPAALLTF